MHHAQLVGNSQTFFDRRDNPAMRVGDHQPQGLAVQSSVQQVFYHGCPGSFTLPVAYQISQKMPFEIPIHPDSHQQGLFHASLLTPDCQVKRIQVQVLDPFG